MKHRFHTPPPHLRAHRQHGSILRTTVALAAAPVTLRVCASCVCMCVACVLFDDLGAGGREGGSSGDQCSSKWDVIGASSLKRHS